MAMVVLILFRFFFFLQDQCLHSYCVQVEQGQGQRQRQVQQGRHGLFAHSIKCLVKTVRADADRAGKTSRPAEDCLGGEEERGLKMNNEGCKNEATNCDLMLLADAVG